MKCDLNPWIITDMHLNHTRMTELCNRPADFTDQILTNLKENVKDGDLLIDLGDILFGDRRVMPDLIGSIPGTKVLVIGNHDREYFSQYIKAGYSFVCDMFVWKKFVFSHRPLKSRPEGVEWNIHGHLHNQGYDHPCDTYKKETWHLKFSLEDQNYYGPIKLRDFLAQHRIAY